MVMAAAAMTILMLMMVVMMLMGMLQRFQLRFHGGMALHSIQQLFAGKLAPGCGNQRSMIVMLTDQRDSRIQLCLGNGIGAGQDHSGGGLDLVVVELTEVLHIDLHFAGIRHRDGIAQRDLIAEDMIHRGHNIRKLTDTGGLDQDPLGGILSDHLLQSLAKVTHKGTANAAGVHLGNIDARILQKAAIDADLAEFIFDQHKLLALVGLLDHLLDQRGFTGTKEAGVNIDLAVHGLHLPVIYLRFSCGKFTFKPNKQ